MYHLQTARPVRRRQRLPADPRRAASARRRRSSRSGTRPARSSGSGSTPATPLAEPERTFLHRYYDAVVVGGEWTRAAVRGGPPDAGRAGPRARLAADRLLLRRRRRWPPRASGVLAAHPALAGRRVVALRADLPRSRASASGRRRGSTRSRLRAALPADHALVLKTHPNLDPATTPTDGFDVVVDPAAEINDLLAADRHPHHRLLVVGRRVRAAPPADRPARRRPGRVRGRPRAVPRLPDRDDRHAGGRHRRGHRGDRDRPVRPVRLRRLHRAPARARRGAARASASSTTSSATGRAPDGRGDTLPPDVRHE